MIEAFVVTSGNIHQGHIEIKGPDVWEFGMDGYT